jgi:branched-chain amino acid transport system ATP-binding protein
MAHILEIEDIHTFIGQFHILEGVSFEVPEGSVTVLLGRNGAGKTTTLRSIMGILTASEGHIRFQGRNILGMPTYNVAQLGIGYVPEHRAIFRGLSTKENLEIAERKKGQLERRLPFIFEVFPDLERFYNWPAGQLSGGQQQMLAIARALVADNRLLLIDEPSEGLAPVIIEQLMNAIRQLSEQTTVLLVEQNFKVASSLGDHYAIIEDGRSVHYGKMDNLVKDEALIQKYLGAA